MLDFLQLHAWPYMFISYPTPPTLPLSHAVSKLSKVADCQLILARFPAVLFVWLPWQKRKSAIYSENNFLLQCCELEMGGKLPSSFCLNLSSHFCGGCLLLVHFLLKNKFMQFCIIFIIFSQFPLFFQFPCLTSLFPLSAYFFPVFPPIVTSTYKSPLKDFKGWLNWSQSVASPGLRLEHSSIVKWTKD